MICLAGEPAHDYDQLFSGITPAVVYLLNEAKNSSAWGVYFPFTLSIRDPKNLLAFLQGQVYILVVFDHSAMSAVAKKHGMTVTFHRDESDDSRCEVAWDQAAAGETMTARISRHFMDRIACELLSWEWVVLEERERFLTWHELVGTDEQGPTT